MLAKTLASALIAVSTLGFIAGSAHAGVASDPDVRTMKISVADIDLRTEAGAQAALHRIQSAARAVCGDTTSLHDMSEYARQRACLKAAVTRAVTTLNSPLVASLSHTNLQAVSYTDARR
ncbi:MAG: UrcA family protein [Phenylobacterium sp.]|nr:MAG: UrcA family protein [Phenylobacterium sp.]